MGATEDTGLPLADGPLVLLSLHDGQTLYAVVKCRRRERDASWWYDVQLHLPGQATVRGQLECEPCPVDLRVPHGMCTPVPGQDYAAVPTERYGVTPDWRIEQPLYPGVESGPACIVHRGSCASCRDNATTASRAQARAALRRPDAAACQICRPDRVLLRTG